MNNKNLNRGDLSSYLSIGYAKAYFVNKNTKIFLTNNNKNDKYIIRSSNLL